MKRPKVITRPRAPECAHCGASEAPWSGLHVAHLCVRCACDGASTIDIAPVDLRGHVNLDLTPSNS